MEILRKLKGTIDKYTEYRALGGNDILLASFPKTGNTYTRFVLANVIALQELKGKEVNFFNLGEILPELGVSDLSRSWPHKSLPRVIKTHRPYRDAFKKAGTAICVIRDPRDTMISYYNYQKARKSVSYAGSLSEFIKDKGYGIKAYNDHVEGWLEHKPNVLLYKDIIEEGLSSFKQLFQKLDIDVPQDILLEAIARSQPDVLKKVELKEGRPKQDKNFKKGYVFIRNASVGQWKGTYTDDDMAYFKANVSPRFIELGFKF